MSSPTNISLPPSLPYPIKITSLGAVVGSSIERGTRLLSYSFVYISADPSEEEETRFGTWDSSVEGTIESWKIKPNDVILAKKAERPVLTVIEPCKHGIQIGGLCGICGKDMTEFDYTGWSDASRASIQMTHSAFGPTVSLEEAQKLERATAEHLLKSRKLSLIVDLDQTIVHATVDPTVGEWIAEGKAWEERQRQKNGGRDRSDSDPPIPGDEDECNPNWEALRDVKNFRLGPESFAGPSKRRRNGNTGHLIENEGCMYYVKPRPGWEHFLTEISKQYEMHVYTMGTRAYAEQVCAAIDPDGKYFATRILSRDESGSLTQKNLQRLFPCDTSMVVIIDDRADVWEWSPNLIKVVPYDFFVGIGDINSAFLPKVEPLAAGAVANAPEATSPPPSHQPKDPTVATPPTPEQVEEADLAANAMLTQNSIALEAQRDERPLAKKQEELQDQAADKEKADTAESREGTLQSNDSPLPTPAKPLPAETAKPIRKALLKNNDWELIRLSTLLEDVHNRFFEAYNSRRSDLNDNSKSRLTGKKKRLANPYDVTQIIPQLRAETFKGVNILFSSVIPLDTKPETTEIWKMALMFGATCSTELTSEVTHVVAAKRGTMKVDAARRRGGIKVVWLSWFTDSLALWRHQDETLYLLEEPKQQPFPGRSSSPSSDPTQISSDPDPDDDEWQQDEQQPSLELESINWNDINDEVEAAMNESDDDDYEVKSGIASANVSDIEDGSMGDPNSAKSSPQSTPRLKRKRMRSSTPSELGSIANGKDELLRSPLSKRKRLAADRSGSSKLKQGITALDIDQVSVQEEDNDSSMESARDNDDGHADDADNDDESLDSDSGNDAMPDDDFLASALEEDWG